MLMVNGNLQKPLTCYKRRGRGEEGYSLPSNADKTLNKSWQKEQKRKIEEEVEIIMM